MKVEKKQIITECCLCNESIEIDELYQHTLDHLKEEVSKKKLLLELSK